LNYNNLNFSRIPQSLSVKVVAEIPICERLGAKYLDMILQQAAAGGGRNDLGTSGRFHETYLTDGLNMPRVLQNFSPFYFTVEAQPNILSFVVVVFDSTFYPVNEGSS
jgi:hypothetical protein